MKRAIAISFLMLATITIVAHAVIPHHHHAQIPVAFATAHHHDTHEHDSTHNCDCNTHEHCNFEDCLLFNTIVRANNETQIKQFTDFAYAALPLFSVYSTPDIDNAFGLPFRQKPYLISYLTEYISQSLGLRAPPVC